MIKRNELYLEYYFVKLVAFSVGLLVVITISSVKF